MGAAGVEEDVWRLATEHSGIVHFTSVQQPLLTSDGHLFKQSLSVNIS